MTTETETFELLRGHRVAMIEELGFSNEEAEKLADSYYQVTVKGKKGDSLVHQRVDAYYIKKLMEGEGGATREQVVRILV